MSRLAYLDGDRRRALEPSVREAVRLVIVAMDLAGERVGDANHIVGRVLVVPSSMETVSASLSVKLIMVSLQRR